MYKMKQESIIFGIIAIIVIGGFIYFGSGSTFASYTQFDSLSLVEDLGQLNLRCWEGTQTKYSKTDTYIMYAGTGTFSACKMGFEIEGVEYEKVGTIQGDNWCRYTNYWTDKDVTMNQVAMIGSEYAGSGIDEAYIYCFGDGGNGGNGGNGTDCNWWCRFIEWLNLFFSRLGINIY